MRIKNGMANILPALLMPKHPPTLQFDLRQQLARAHVRILVQRHLPARPLREVYPIHPQFSWDCVHGKELHLQEEGRIGLGLLAGDGEPALDGVTGDEVGGGDGYGANELGAEKVVVLDVEVDVGGGVGEGDEELLVPLRVLVVGDDDGSGDGGAGEGYGDVGVAGDALLEGGGPVVGFVGFGGGGGPGGGGFVGDGEGEAAGGKAAAEALGEEVQVGEGAGLDDVEVQVAVEQGVLHSLGNERLELGRERGRATMGVSEENNV